MKRTSKKNQRELKLNRRLELVRMTIRELTPAQLEQVNGGDTTVKASPEATGCHVWPDTE